MVIERERGTDTHRHTHAHAHTHARTHTHAHTRTYTHTLCFGPLVLAAAVGSSQSAGGNARAFSWKAWPICAATSRSSGETWLSVSAGQRRCFPPLLTLLALWRSLPIRRYEAALSLHMVKATKQPVCSLSSPALLPSFLPSLLSSFLPSLCLGATLTCSFVSLLTLLHRFALKKRALRSA